jgi:hypothetical protein
MSQTRIEGDRSALAPRPWIARWSRFSTEDLVWIVRELEAQVGGTAPGILAETRAELRRRREGPRPESVPNDLGPDVAAGPEASWWSRDPRR